MTSGGNNFNYFHDNQLIKFSAVLQFKRSEKSPFTGPTPNGTKRCLVSWVCCAVLWAMSSHRSKSTLLKWKCSSRTVLS